MASQFNAAFWCLALNDAVQLAVLVQLQVPDFLLCNGNAQRIAHALEAGFCVGHHLGIQAVHTFWQAGDSIGQHGGHALRVVQANSHIIAVAHRARTLQHTHDVLRIGGKVAIHTNRQAAHWVADLCCFNPGWHLGCKLLALLFCRGVLFWALAVRVNGVTHFNLLSLSQLLQNDDVGHDHSAGVFLECGIRQADQA